MNCHEDAARRGWEIYRCQESVVSLEEINDQLRAESLDPVSIRMYRHYRRLASNGFARYVPINELDIRLKLARVAGV